MEDTCFLCVIRYVYNLLIVMSAFVISEIVQCNNVNKPEVKSGQAEVG